VHQSDTDPSEFLAKLTDHRRDDLVVVDTLLTAALPKRQRVLWEGVFWGGTEQTIIGYGDLVQQRPRGEDVEWFIIGLALQKKHLSLYVNAVEDGAYLGAHYGDRLGKVKLGAASIGFTSVDRLDLTVLEKLAVHADRISPADRTA